MLMGLAASGDRRASANWGWLHTGDPSSAFSRVDLSTLSWVLLASALYPSRTTVHSPTIEGCRKPKAKITFRLLPSCIYGGKIAQGAVREAVFFQ